MARIVGPLRCLKLPQIMNTALCRPILVRPWCGSLNCRTCSFDNKGLDRKTMLPQDSCGYKDPGIELTLPEEPDNCCMSGCANCVWITYAEQLSKVFKDGGRKARETVLSKVTDPSMKIFLLMELKDIEEDNKVS